MSAAPPAVGPAWPRGAAGFGLGLALIAVVGAGLWLLRAALAPLVLGLVFAELLEPAVGLLVRRGWRRGAAVLLVMLAAALAVAGLVAVVVPVVAREVGTFAQAVPDYARRLRDQIVPLVDRFLAEGQTVEGLLEQLEIRLRAVETWEVLGPRLAAPLRAVVTHLTSSLVTLLVTLLQLALVPVLTAYLLLDRPLLAAGAAAWVPSVWRAGFVSLAHDVHATLQGWLRGQVVVAAVLAVIYMIGLGVLGTPLALPLGLVAGAANMVPYLGLALGVVPALLLNGLEHHSLARLLGVVLVFALAQFLEGNFLTPRLVGSRVGLHPVAVMVAVMIGGSVFGFSGLLLAVPATAALSTALRHLARHMDETVPVAPVPALDAPVPDDRP